MPSTPQPETIAHQLHSASFDDWYHAQTITRNIQNGTPEYNDPPPIRGPTEHTPHNLLQCHRKVTYRQTNAPAEQQSPDGLFWTSRKIETDLILPYLRDVVSTDRVFVTDSMYVDTTIETSHGSLTVCGRTDPVIVDRTGNPLLVTEVKTTESVAQLDQPHPHHRAQVHAYMYGVMDDVDDAPPASIILYIDRSTFELESFYQPFDEPTWKHVQEWARTQTRYREAETLPPATPEHPWECSSCAYKHRCGKTELPFGDSGSTGLLPGYRSYPRRHLVTYLDTYADAGAKLTPTLATIHPDLASNYGSYDWLCPTCSRSFQWQEITTETHGTPPVCPTCATEDVLSILHGPSPVEQCDP